MNTLYYFRGYNPPCSSNMMNSLPVWMFGKEYICNDNELGTVTDNDDTSTIAEKKSSFPSFVSDFESRIWCTYRKDFPIIETSYYTSDMGWGCMHRTAQMTLAQGFLHHYLGRDWRLKEGEEVPAIYYEILQLFADNVEAPYSVHNISLVGSRQNKAVGEWYGPSTVALAIKELVETHSKEFVVYVSDNGTIYRDEVEALCENWTKSLFILIPVRLGVEAISDSYQNIITTLFQYPQSLGMVGGKPRSSLYFVAVQGDRLFYLDPHVVFPSIDSTQIPFDVSSHQPKDINNIKISHIDPSFAASFYCRDAKDFDSFCEQSAKFRQTMGDDHIFCIADTREVDECEEEFDMSWPEDSVVLRAYDAEIEEFVLL